MQRWTDKSKHVRIGDRKLEGTTMRWKDTKTLTTAQLTAGQALLHGHSGQAIDGELKIVEIQNQAKCVDKLFRIDHHHSNALVWGFGRIF